MTLFKCFTSAGRSWVCLGFFPVSPTFFHSQNFNEAITGRGATLNSWSNNNYSVVTHTELTFYTTQVGNAFLSHYYRGTNMHIISTQSIHTLHPFRIDLSCLIRLKDL